jgi:Uncharacterized alpha/beta hydrolase domain (DUF2235)
MRGQKRDTENYQMPHVNLHAIAIDEQRQPFEPSLWRRSKFKHFSTAVEKVWFPGAHADIGEDKTASSFRTVPRKSLRRAKSSRASNNALRSLASVILCPLWGKCAAR